MNKKALAILISILAGTGVGTSLTLGQICPSKNEKLNIGNTHACLSQNEYRELKTALWEEYNDKSKDYDFEIGNRDLVIAVLNNELDGADIKFGKINKAEIKNTMLKLLQPN